MVRIVEGIRGTVQMRMELCAALRLWAHRAVGDAIGDGVRAVAGPNLAILRASVPMHGENLKTVAEFTVAARGTRMVLADVRALARGRPDGRSIAEQALKETEKFWQEWTRGSQVEGQVSRGGGAIADHAEGDDV